MENPSLQTHHVYSTLKRRGNGRDVFGGLYFFAWELSQNRTEKQIMLLKATLNWLFNDI